MEVRVGWKGAMEVRVGWKGAMEVHVQNGRVQCKCTCRMEERNGSVRVGWKSTVEVRMHSMEVG